MKRLLNVQWRLTSWYAAVLTGIVAVFGLCIYGMMSRYLLSRTDFELDEELQELQVEVDLSTSEAQLQRQLRDRYYRHLGFDFQVSRLDGTVLFRSERLTSQLTMPLVPKLPATQRGTFRVTRTVTGMGPLRFSYRIARRATGPSGYYITLALLPLKPNAVALRTLLLTMAALSPFAIIAALLGGRILAWHAMSPIDRMAATASKITASRLQTRLTVENNSDELGNLARTLNQMMDRVERAVNELRRFTADAAHELRTPLAVLLTEAEVALRTPRSTDEYRRVIQVILNELQRLNRLAEQLLQLSRSESRAQSPHLDEVPLDALLGDVTEHLGVMAENKGVRLQLGPMQQWVVQGDDIQLSRMLLNLVENGIKFTPTGGSVRIDALEENGHIELTIADTGIGISPEDLPHVGERFYRSDKSRNGQTGGTGLGMAICKAVVEAHGGTLTIDSQEKKGTIVRVCLPLVSVRQSRLLN